MKNKSKPVKFLGILLTVFLIQTACFGQSMEVEGTILNVKNEGAFGDGLTDDTKSIQATINKASKGDTVYIPEGVYMVKSLGLKSEVHIKSEGVLKQWVEEVEEFTHARQNSTYPLFRGKEVSDVYISIKTESRNESIYLSNSQNIIIDQSSLRGDSTKLRSFSGILLYKCDNITVSRSFISYYGTPRQNTHSYQPGTGIRILESKNIVIHDSDLSYNGENGVFIHSSPDVEIRNSCFQFNGMSGIQVAFGSLGIEKNYTFVHNSMEYNSGDAIDINNRSPKGILEINCLIGNNNSKGNGFVRNESTPDGSGIATLINVSGVKMINNLAEKNNRPAIYLESCGSIYAKGNTADNQVEIVKELEEFKFVSNEFESITLIADVIAGRIILENNKLNTVHLPNGITIDSLLFRKNEFRNTSFNFNLKGNIRLIENRIYSQSPNTAILIVSANSVSLEKNDIISHRSGAVFVRKMANNVSIVNNTIQSADACITDDGSNGLLISGNTLTSIKGGKTRHTLRSINPNNLNLRNNEHIGVENIPAILLQGKGSAQLDSERITQGTTDLGTVKVTIKGF